jgi:formylglycine-generating enzyme required for sulfatase activity
MKIFNIERLRLVVGALAAASFCYEVCQFAAAQTSGLAAGSVFRDCLNCPEMVVLPEGNFIMGSSQEEMDREIEAAPSSAKSIIQKFISTEKPQHEVTINLVFALAKFPITRNQFAAFVEETGYAQAPGCILYALQYHVSPQADWRLPGLHQTEQDPAVCVSWQDAKAYVEWLNKKSMSSRASANDGPYRLPTEAEWEYAARGGTSTARWWGDSIGRNNAVCARCGSKWDQEQTAPVGSFHPNPFGLYDVLGNALQWTEDCWNESYVDAPVDGGPWTTGNCDRRVGRGGSWAAFSWLVRSATRSGLNRENRYDFVGFRVAKTLKPSS